MLCRRALSVEFSFPFPLPASAMPRHFRWISRKNQPKRVKFSRTLRENYSGGASVPASRRRSALTRQGRLVSSLNLPIEILPPMRAHPDVAMTAMAPVAAHPNGARMRTRSPVAGAPNPASTPFPRAANPDKRRIGSHGNNLDLQRRWLAWTFHDHFARRRGLLHNHDTARLAFNNAPRQQWQASGD